MQASVQVDGDMTRPFLLAAALAAGFVSLSAGASLAGPISTACMAAARPGANPGLCGCIQNVADQTLSRSDQRQAAKFFRDPDAAQQIRTSTNSRHSEFWQRYKAFGARAEATCG